MEEIKAELAAVRAEAAEQSDRLRRLICFIRATLRAQEIEHEVLRVLSPNQEIS